MVIARIMKSPSVSPPSSHGLRRRRRIHGKTKKIECFSRIVGDKNISCPPKPFAELPLTSIVLQSYTGEKLALENKVIIVGRRINFVEPWFP